MDICYIVGAVPSDCRPDPGEKDFVVAADRGYSQLREWSIRPDFVVGDFDSLGTIPENENILRHPVMKDDSDMMLAVKLGLEKGFSDFRIYGGLGERLDHTFANIQALEYIALRGGRGWLISSSETVTVLHQDSISFPPETSGSISVFALGGQADGVYLEGLLYPLNDALLTPDFPLGLSNEFTGQSSSVKVREGTLLLIMTR